jgi:hypothetical protein
MQNDRNFDLRKLFTKYNLARSGGINFYEFTFLVRDLMFLRNDVEPSLDEAHDCSKRIASELYPEGAVIVKFEDFVKISGCKSFQDEKFTSVLEDLIALVDSTDQNRDANGAPVDDVDTSPPKLARCTSAEITRNQLEVRELTCLAVRNDRERVAAQIDRESSNEFLIEPVESIGDSSTPMASCSLCFEQLPKVELWGGGSLRKDCPCDIYVCLSCLGSSAHYQIKDGQQATCPHMVSYNPPRRCTVPIDRTLLSIMFRDKCCLCNATTELFSVPCCLEIYHIFCAACLYDHLEKCVLDYKRLPACPRAAECRFELGVESVGEIIQRGRGRITQKRKSRLSAPLDATGFPMISSDDLLTAWHQLRITSAQQAWSGNKPCPQPDCKGFLSRTRKKSKVISSYSNARFVLAAPVYSSEAIESVSSMPVVCSECHVGTCWNCLKRPHRCHTCDFAKETEAKWKHFVDCINSHGDAIPDHTTLATGRRQLGRFGRVEPRGGGSGGGSVGSRLEALSNEANFFRQSILSGNLKKCPKCLRVINKLGGCDQMVPRLWNNLFNLLIYIIIDMVLVLTVLCVSVCRVCRCVVETLTVETSNRVVDTSSVGRKG